MLRTTCGMSVVFALAFYSTSGQAGHNTFLEEQNDNHQRNGHNHRSGGNFAPGDGMFAIEACDPDGDRLCMFINRQGQTKEEVVPDSDERENSRCEDTRSGEWHDYFPQGTHPRGPTHPSCLFQAWRRIPEERG